MLLSPLGLAQTFSLQNLVLQGVESSLGTFGVVEWSNAHSLRSNDQKGTWFYL